MSSYPTAIVLTVATTTFAEREPQIAELMSNVQFTNAQMNEVLHGKIQMVRLMKRQPVYSTNYKDVWGNWLNDDARANLSALLN